MKIINKTKTSIIAEQAGVADTAASRMKGLLPRSGLNEGEGLVITRCNSIHMFFMKFAIDAIFVDSKDMVVGLVKDIRPWGLSPIFFKANYVIELPSGTIEKTKTAIGDLIQKIPS